MRDAKKVSKMTAAQAGFTANATTTVEQATEEAKYQISTKLGVAFDNLAMAAQAKASTIDDLTQALSDVTKTMETLSRTN